MNPAEFRIGEAKIAKVHELDLNDFAARSLLPGFDPIVLNEHPDCADPITYNAASGKVYMSVHTWVVWFQGEVIVVDTGAGNGKSRPTMKALDHLNQPYLERLETVGVLPADVNYVLLTHIHADHVGWNTRYDGEAWIPTFPNATIICSDREWRYGAALEARDQEEVTAIKAEAGYGEPLRIPLAGVFSDSMAPIQKAGRMRRIEVDGSEVIPGIRFLPSPGHSIDHASITISSQGRLAIFGGDIAHHPFELQNPELVSCFCEFPEMARRSRRQLLEQAVNSNALYFSSHFPGSSAGYVRREGEHYRWEFVHPEGG